MTGWFNALLVFILFLIWIRIDFVTGRQQQRRDARRSSPDIHDSQLELLPIGDDFFHRLYHDMNQATTHIHFLFYIIRYDHIGKRIIQLLEDKAREGVAVRVLVDRLGSDLPKKAIKKMKKAGVEFAYSNSPRFPFFFFTLNRRNHRKIVVVDGKVGFIGGYNIGDEYLGRDPRFGRWRDFHLRLQGDGVQVLQLQFLKDWKKAAGKAVTNTTTYPPLLKGEHKISLLPTNGVFLEKTFIHLVKQAKKSVTIGTPYYIPGAELQKELIKLARRGVDVRLIVPKKADHPLVKEASFPYLQDLLEAGIEIFQYYRGFYHVKALVVDDILCDIGTANFDKRSFHLNDEINCLIYDRDFIRQVKVELNKDIAASEQLTLEAFTSRSLFQKGKEKLATLVSGLL